MEYSVNMKIIEKLIEIETKIFESFQNMLIFSELEVDSCNSVMRDVEIEKLKMLLKKENMLLNQIPQNSEFIKYVYDLVSHNQSNFFDNDVLASSVLNRFGNIMIDLVNICLDEEDMEIYEDEGIELDDIDKYSYRIMIRDNLNVKNICYLEELKKNYNNSFDDVFTSTQYFISYSYKNVGDILTNNSFSIDKISFKSDEEMRNYLNLSIENFQAIKNDELYNMAQEIFLVILSNLFHENSPELNSIIVKDSIRLRFFLHEMDTPVLCGFEEFVSEIVKGINEENDLVMQLKDIVDSELEKRPDKPKKYIETNPSRITIDDTTANNLIELIKVEEELLKVFDEIDFDKIQTDAKISELTSLVEIEKKLIKNISINYKVVDIVEELLVRDMEFFFQSDASGKELVRKKKLIYDRIHNIVPFFQHLDLSPIQSEKSYSSISQNHLVEALKLFEKVICDAKNNDQRKSLKKLRKELFFVNGILLDDYIVAKGNYKLIERPSDYITSKFIGLSDVEYAFDKDEQLYERGKEIIEEILSYEDSWESDLSTFALFKFRLSELRDIIVNVSDEHFYSLPEVIRENNTYRSPKTKKIIRKIIKK